jgi:hypothetical protein
MRECLHRPPFPILSHQTVLYAHMQCNRHVAVSGTGCSPQLPYALKMSLPVIERFSDAEIKCSSIEIKIEIVIYLLVGNQKLLPSCTWLLPIAIHHPELTTRRPVCSREPHNVSKEDTIDLWMQTAMSASPRCPGGCYRQLGPVDCESVSTSQGRHHFAL